jgi:uncharacterized membrane protein YbhN (UPF0104 family)
MEDGRWEEPEAPRRRSRLIRFLKAGGSLLIGWALLVGVMPRFADLGQVWHSVVTMGIGEVLLLAVFAAWNIITYQFLMMAAMPGLRLKHAFLTGQIATAVSNTVPAGSVVGIGVLYAVLSSFGHQAQTIAIASVVTGWWNTLVRFALPAAALMMLALRGGTHAGLLSGAITGLVLLGGGVAILVLMTGSDRFARATGRVTARVWSALRRVFRRPPVTGWEEAFSRFRTNSAGLIKARWHWLTVTTVLSHLSLFWVLLAGMRYLGVPQTVVSWPEALGAFAVVRLATALPITPGGIGLVEVGLTAALMIAAGGDSGYEGAIVAAVLLYRVLTYLLQVVLGVLSYFVWQNDLRRMRVAEEVA